ncbi:Crp/Fnr family transcriptional regulator [Xanthobacteraceae bacterium Astr-EGSB]|uniref:Crp/Fnr family transcriptional regulator n=1 Tax=Astrobacterium formosum TaxID=3069710 RepID=UPI0027B4C8D1|nr:Crp/Fnr family transcriptional regulator [Xanthobacteraceae bacterium Astr-EGSB]
MTLLTDDLATWPVRRQAKWPPRNQILTTLGTRELEHLRPMLEPVTMKARCILSHSKAPLEHVYFVEEGLISVLAQIDQRRVVEVWLIGSEGVMGIPLVLGGSASPHRRIVALGGSAYRMSASAVQAAMQRFPSFAALLLRYVQAVLVQTSQAGACNTVHRLEQRLARWLLTAADRCGGEVLPITHDILARMLGVRRASVSECFGTLERVGILKKRRGFVQIVDRAGLEERTCRCYRIMQNEMDRTCRDFETIRKANGGERNHGGLRPVRSSESFQILSAEADH